MRLPAPYFRASALKPNHVRTVKTSLSIDDGEHMKASCLYHRLTHRCMQLGVVGNKAWLARHSSYTAVAQKLYRL